MASSAYPSFTTPIIGAADQPGVEPTVLSSRTTVQPDSGGLPSGGSGGGASSGGGFSASGLGGVLSTGIPLLLSLFGNNTDKSNAESSASTLASQGNTLFSQGTTAFNTGQAALAPVLKYLTAVAGGDPQALMNATAPQRAQVIDQYATAKKSLMFTPRGGGQASAVGNLEAKQASDLSTINANARTQGVNELASVSQAESSLGLNSENAGTSAAAHAADIYAKLGEQSSQEQAGLGASIGKFVGAAVPFLLGLF